ncbi:MAG: zinc ribbon domain-containing protein [Bacteroidales bacterium]|jgi:hypothetical protein|nr:zinc ribbon domain-containing protein [Bacteroidales bacterium]
MSVNTALNITLIVSLSGLLITLTAIFLIARWIYFDAKSRGISPTPWVIITAIVYPNFIGLIMYILTRSKSNMLCNRCNHNIANSMKFCPNCGEKTEGNTTVSASKITYKSLVWGIVLLVIFSVTAILGGKIYSVLPPKDGDCEIYATSMTSTHLINHWESEFQLFVGWEEYFFDANHENPTLVYSSTIAMGKISFEVYDWKDNLIKTIPSNTYGEITDLVQGKQYKVVAKTDGLVSGKFSFKMEYEYKSIFNLNTKILYK